MNLKVNENELLMLIFSYDVLGIRGTGSTRYWEYEVLGIRDTGNTRYWDTRCWKYEVLEYEVLGHHRRLDSNAFWQGDHNWSLSLD